MFLWGGGALVVAKVVRCVVAVVLVVVCVFASKSKCLPITAAIVIRMFASLHSTPFAARDGATSALHSLKCSELVRETSK